MMKNNSNTCVPVAAKKHFYNILKRKSKNYETLKTRLVRRLAHDISDQRVIPVLAQVLGVSSLLAFIES